MDWSPHTPLHSRGPSVIIDTASPSSPHPHSTTASPLTPNHALTRADSMGLIPHGEDGGNGLANLADELAEAWSDDEGDEEGDVYYEEASIPQNITQPPKTNGIHSIPIPTPFPARTSSLLNLSGSPEKQTLIPPAQPALAKTLSSHKRQASDYDGSEYGEGDLEVGDGIPASLQARMDMVESLARRGTDCVVGVGGEGVIGRVVGQLRELGGQAGVESGTTRLITTHTALTTNIAHQARILHTQTYPLLAHTASVESNTLQNQLLPSLQTLSSETPAPSSRPLNSLQTLHSLTADLLLTLHNLQDTLQTCKQTTTIATRRLRASKELVEGMRADERGVESARGWIEEGKWGRRLESRECRRVCEGEIGGFEEYCEGWRRRLFGSVEVG